MRISHFWRSPAEIADTFASSGTLNGIRAEERLELASFLAPVDHRRYVVARQHQVFGDRHRRHQREVLVDHAEPERVRVLGIGDRLFVAVDQDVALGRRGNSP